MGDLPYPPIQERISFRDMATKDQTFPNTIHGVAQALAYGEQKDGIKMVRYNVLKQMIEANDRGTWRPWTDNDDNWLIGSMQTSYSIKSKDNILRGLELYAHLNEQNPLTELLDSLVWDGVPRIHSFLADTMEAEADAYTSECSRIIFAGGVNRAYNPGCKFDDVIVLIGGQGCGKSTLCHWLAIKEEYYESINTFDGKESAEQLQGVWIGEIDEMMADARAKQVEAVKSFITRQQDNFREAYGRRKTIHKRSCIFIGTKNDEEFLRDRTGNRRFYPVLCHTQKYELFDHEKEVRERILQCWAEAVHKYKAGDDYMRPVADYHLQSEFESHQAAAMIDDWRDGKLQGWLDDLPAGTQICVRQAWEEALGGQDENGLYNANTDGRVIGQIIRNQGDWIKVDKPQRMKNYGVQKVYRKVVRRSPEPKQVETPEDMPF